MNRDELQNHLEARLKDNPKSLIFARLADLYLEDKRISEAIQLCTEGLKHHPSYVTGHFVLAKSYLANLENDNAETALKSVLSHDREYLSAYLLLGDLMKNMGWENKAATYYREILAIDPSEELAKERLATLNESTTWDFSALEEEPTSENTEDIAIEDLEEEDWANDIREVFPDEISADVLPLQSVQEQDDGQETDIEEEPKETLQDIDTFLNDQASQPISDTPEFFSITDSEQNAPVQGKSDVGPEEEKIAAEFLGDKRASETIQNIDKEPESLESASAIESPEEIISVTSEETVTTEFTDSQDIITEQDFEEALGVFDELDSPITPQEKEASVSPETAPEDQDVDLENIESEEVAAEVSPVDSEETLETFDESGSDTEPQYKEKFVSPETPSEAEDQTLNIDGIGLGEETSTPQSEEKEPEAVPDTGIEDSFELSEDLSGEENSIIPADDSESKTAEDKPEESSAQDLEKAVSESVPIEHSVPESEPETFSEKDTDSDFSGLNEFISEQPSVDIPKSPPPAQKPSKKKEKSTPVPEETQAAEKKSSTEPKETPPAETSSPASEEPEKESPPPKRIITSTLGEIYAAQGQYDKAIAVYEELLEENPEITRYKEKIEEFRKKLNESGQ